MNKTLSLYSFYYQYEVVEKKFMQTLKTEENLRLREFEIKKF